MSSFAPSITLQDTFEPFELQLARGQIQRHTSVFKFGFNLDVNGTEETVWDAGGIYTYPASALTMTLTSAAGATDNGVEVTVIGLDTNWDEVTQTVTLAGAGTATLATALRRVYRAYVSGSTESTGVVTIASGGTTYAQIAVSDQQTLMTVYTVPAGYTAYLYKGTVSVGTTNVNQYVTARLKIRTFGGVMRTASKVTLSNGFIDFDFGVPIAVTEKSDIETRAVSSGANNAVSATLTIVLISNTGF